MILLSRLQLDLKLESNPEQADVLQKFFKTGPGEYGEGDKFIGIKVPILRCLAKKYTNLQFLELENLINSLIHEERLIAILILLEQYKRKSFRGNDNCGKNPERNNSHTSASAMARKAIYEFYVANMRQVNNWDLVDLSAPHIIGHYLFDKDQQILRQWANDQNLWFRRISIIATLYFIRQDIFQPTLEISAILLNDKQDLIHKAVGWMLREVGKRNLEQEEEFLRQHYLTIPRTMLRYAIERFPEAKRQAYLKGHI